MDLNDEMSHSPMNQIHAPLAWIKSKLENGTVPLLESTPVNQNPLLMHWTMNRKSMILACSGLRQR